MTHDTSDGRRPSGTSVPPERVVALVGAGMAALAAAIACGVFALNATRPPPSSTTPIATSDSSPGVRR